MIINDIAQRVTAIVGDSQVISDSSALAAYHTENPLLSVNATPALAVKPRNVEELQALVKLANEIGLNLIVVSSTGPHRKGGIAADTGHVVVDLSGWKRIDFIDRRNRVCRIEPGVTYGELLTALEPAGLTVPMPLVPRSGKSVIAAVTDREPPTWPNRQWDIADPVASTEFVFGTGDLFRTGAAGGPGTLEQQRAASGAQKSPLGPAQTDFHRVVQGSQGAMGIVTWVTLRCELKPSVTKPLFVGAETWERLQPFVYEVQRPWLGEHALILNATAAAMVMARDAAHYTALRRSLPPFVVFQNVAGFMRLPYDRVEYQYADITDIASRHGLVPASKVGDIKATDMLHRISTEGAEPDWREVGGGKCLSVIFETTLDRVPGFLAAAHDVLRGDGYDGNELGIYVQPVVQNHFCDVEFLLPYDPSPANIERMRSLEEKLTAALASAGAFFSRPYGMAAKLAYAQNPGAAALLGRIKDIFDPNGVLNRGKWKSSDTEAQAC